MSGDQLLVPQPQNGAGRGRTSSQLGWGFLPRQKLERVQVALRSIDILWGSLRRELDIAMTEGSVGCSRGPLSGGASDEVGERALTEEDEGRPARGRSHGTLGCLQQCFREPRRPAPGHRERGRTGAR